MKIFWKIANRAIRQWLADGAFQLAAALSFYAVVSLAPVVILSLSIASLFYGEQARRGELVAQIDHMVGRPGAEVIEGILASARRNDGGFFGWISVGILLVGASAVFLQVQTALNAVWNLALRPDVSWLHTLRVRLLSMALVLGAGLLLLGVTLAGAVLEFLAGTIPAAAPLWQGVNFSCGVLIEALLFATLFKVLPDAIIDWRDVWVGALVTAILFEIGRLGIGFYFAKSAPGSAYGSSGSLVAVLLWIYYSALILLLGAEIAQVYARLCGKRILPAAHAYRTSQLRLPVDEEGNPVLDSDVIEEIRRRAAWDSGGAKAGK